tara:strand:+ start:775 stop:2043 length:1269 start_codon:yes stop_codon:yes gene_type:complete
MAITKTINRTGGKRNITLSGNPGAKFELYVKQGSNYYSFDTNSFQTVEKILKNQTIPSNGVYVKEVILPEVTSDTSYDFYINALPGTNLNVSKTHTQKIGTIFQKATKTATFNTTSSSLTIASALTGGTLSDVNSSLIQTGAITKGGSPLLYIHSTPSWNADDGGNWTNANTVTTVVNYFNGAVVQLKDGTNISSGYAVTGDNIVDEITVSAISGNKVTLSAAQNLTDGQELTFSKSGWEVGPITAKITNSGTSSITMKMIAEIKKTGIADLTSVCSVDNFVSVKPNAFPVPNIECPEGGEIAIDVVTQCINYLGTTKDIDANLSSKTFKVHSVPAEGTSRRPTGNLDDNGDMIYTTLPFAGSSSVSAGSNMGSAGVGEVTYAANALHVAGDEDYFYYKTVDAQSTPVTSATDQGKISITIV